MTPGLKDLLTPGLKDLPNLISIARMLLTLPVGYL